MSMTLGNAKATQVTPMSPRHGRTVASAELRLQIQMADLDSLLSELFAQTEWAFNTDGEVDLASYRRRIDQVDSARHDLETSVSRLTELISVGADTLLITIGRSVCQTLERILESAKAHAGAVEDGA